MSLLWKPSRAFTLLETLLVLALLGLLTGLSVSSIGALKRGKTQPERFNEALAVMRIAAIESRSNLTFSLASGQWASETDLSAFPIPGDLLELRNGAYVPTAITVYPDGTTTAKAVRLACPDGLFDFTINPWLGLDP